MQSIIRADHRTETLLQESTLPLITPTQKSTMRIAFYVGTLFFAVFALFHGGHFYHADEELHFLVANSILDGNGGAIAPFQEAYYRGQFTGVNDFRAMGKTGFGGRFYAKSGPGQAVAVIPLVGLARLVTSKFPGSNPAALQRFIVSFFGPIVAAVGLALWFMFIENLGYRRITCFAVVCMIGFGTFYFVQTKFFFNHMLVSTFLILGLLTIQGASYASVGRLLLGGLCAGCVTITRIDCFTYATLLPAYWFLKNRDSYRHSLRALLLMGLGAAGPLLLLGVWNQHRFGNPIDLGYNISDPSQLSYEALNKDFFTGFFGQIVNMKTGLLWFAPPILVSFAGFINLARRHACVVWTVAIGLLLPLAFYANFTIWAAGSSWGSRFILPSVPLICLGLGPVLEDCFLRRGRNKWFVGLVFALGVSIQLCGLLADHNRGYWQYQKTIEHNPRYAAVPYLRAISQLEALRDHPPDIWWILAWTQVPSGERGATCLVVVSLLALLALDMLKLKRVLGKDEAFVALTISSQ